MTVLALSAVGIFGLMIGSFLNVVIYRVPRALSVISPRSRCPECDTEIRNRHNLPVIGWLLLGGRCADCRAAISVRYPLVEFGTAALFVAVAARFGATAQLPAFLYLAAIAVALALIDLDCYRLPDAIVLPSYGVAALLLTGAAVTSGDWAALGRSILGLVLVGGFYGTIRLISPAGMGLGDVKLAGLLGLFLGWAGWSQLLVGTLAAFLLGSVVGLALIGLGRARRRTRIPFGPAMLAGALLALFVAAPVATFYGHATGLAA